jgi:TonB-dependent SusC/RagA subfamily outer membrane receptor
VRVIQSSPKWKPGKQKGKAVDVYYNMPVVYKLDGEKDIPSPGVETKSNHIQNTPKEKPLEIRFTNNSYENALIIVNGIEILDRKINDLEPSSIESVSVLKGEEAIKAYGEKGKNGVIMIKTKTR